MSCHARLSPTNDDDQSPGRCGLDRETVTVTERRRVTRKVPVLRDTSRSGVKHRFRTFTPFSPTVVGCSNNYSSPFYFGKGVCRSSVECGVAGPDTVSGGEGSGLLIVLAQCTRFVRRGGRGCLGP